MRAFCVIVDDRFFLDAIALFESLRYYGNTSKIKIYDAGNLTDEKKKVLKTYGEVLKINTRGASINLFNGRLLSKWMALSEHMDDTEIFIDADCIVLNNIEHLFDDLEKGNMVVSREWQGDIHLNHTEEEIANINSEFNRCGIDTDFKVGDVLPIYNAGLIGYSRRHKWLLEQCISLMMTKEINTFPSSISYYEQNMMSFLIKYHNIPITILPQENWMNTWGDHKDPQKIISVEDGKLVLLNSKCGCSSANRINFYHFTGDVGIPEDPDQLKRHVSKPHQLYTIDQRDHPHKRVDIEQLWYERHNSPVLLLYEFFLRNHQDLTKK